ncbi:hypothetical protein D3C71_2158020 [compost metagenome]
MGVVSVICAAAAFIFSWVAPSNTGKRRLILQMLMIAIGGLAGTGVAVGSGAGEAVTSVEPLYSTNASCSSSLDKSL